MPSKRKKLPAAARKKAPPRTKKGPLLHLEAPASAPVVENLGPAAWNKFLLAAAAGFWLFSRVNHDPNAEKVFLLVALLMGASYILNLTSLKNVLLLVGLGWVLTALSLGAYPNFTYAFSFLGNFKLPNPLVQFGLGMGLVLAFWRFIPASGSPEDMSKGWARLWFWAIFAVAVYFRMYKVHEAPGIYWDDNAVGITDPRAIYEFKERPFLMPIANREPFFSYFLAGLWALMPNAYAVFIQRFGCGLIDLAGIWLFYLLGKEVGGRRVGLIAAALGAVSKPMIIAAQIGYTNVTVPMAVAFGMLMTLRLFKNPSWKHFIYWGLTLGFMPYNYTSVRPWLLFLVVAVFLWIWFYRREESAPWDLPIGWGTLLGWIFCFLLVNNFLAKQSGWVTFLSRPWVALCLLAVLWFLFFSSFRSASPGKPASLLPRFFIGVFLAGLVIYPMAVQPLVAAHASGLSIFHDTSNLSVHFGLERFGTMFKKTVESLTTLFLTGDDRGDMNLSGDAFFDYHFIAFSVLGLAALFIQPSWMKVFLLISALVGISPHVLSVDPHSGKLVGCVAPLAVLAGLGANQFYLAFKSAFTGKPLGLMAGLVLALYLAWAAQGTTLKVLNTFFTGDRVEKTVSNQVKQFSGQDRVFIAGYPLFVSGVAQCVLDQGYDLYSLRESNPIFLKPGDKPKSAIVLMHIYDNAIKAKIESQFKNAVWDIIYLGGWPDKRIACRRAVVPPSDIPDHPGLLFYSQRVPEENWTRDYLEGRYILGYGVIAQEESVGDLYSAVPSPMWGRLVNLRGSVNLPAAGKVTFKVRTNDYVKFQVDGRQLFYLRPEWNPLLASASLDLAAGQHRVEYDIYLQHEQSIPQVYFSEAGGPDRLMNGLDQPPAPASSR